MAGRELESTSSEEIQVCRSTIRALQDELVNERDLVPHGSQRWKELTGQIQQCGNVLEQSLKKEIRSADTALKEDTDFQGALNILREEARKSNDAAASIKKATDRVNEVTEALGKVEKLISKLLP